MLSKRCLVKVIDTSKSYNHEKTLFHQMLQEPSVILLVFDFALETIHLMKIPCNENACSKSCGQFFTPMSLLEVCRKDVKILQKLNF